MSPASTIGYLFLVTPKLVIFVICKAWLNLSGRDRISISVISNGYNNKSTLSKIGYDGQSSPPSFGRPSLPEFTDGFRLPFHEVSFLVCLFSCSRTDPERDLHCASARIPRTFPARISCSRCTFPEPFFRSFFIFLHKLNAHLPRPIAVSIDVRDRFGKHLPRHCPLSPAAVHDENQCSSIFEAVSGSHPFRIPRLV